MTQAKTYEFSRFRSIFWPIRSFELKKFFPMFVIYSLIVFIYSLLKSAKDALVITAPSAGAVCIPFLKVWGVLPIAFFAVYLFTKLANKYDIQKVFYLLMVGFIGFFLIFSFVLYPNQDLLHPHALADKLQSVLPSGFTGMVALFRNWTFTLFYIMSELWGTIIMTVMFWGIANNITSVKDAKRFYAIFGLGANMATILSGQVSVMISNNPIFSGLLSSSDDYWGGVLKFIVVFSAVLSIIVIYCFQALFRHIKKEACPIKLKENKERRSIKMGLRKNFAYLSKSKYLLCIALIVLCFNLSLNMIEVVWKDQVHHLYPKAEHFNAYMGKVQRSIGILSTLISLFICGPVVRKKGWYFCAMLTPVILLITGALFFGFILSKDLMGGMAQTFLGLSPLAMIVFLGSAQNSFARSSKFTFFDVTKEMSFIPLSQECKLKGKSAIDGVGSRIGKSGGSLFYQFLLMMFGSIYTSLPYIALILLACFVTWIYAIGSLSRQYEEITKPQSEEPETKPLPKIHKPQEVLT
jgi:ATP:ADP antiporter, AAA family